LYSKLTRHHDDYIREKYIKKLIELDSAYAIPYALQLASEYVLEITMVILNSIEKFDKTALKDFIENNQVYVNKSRDRMISYRDCYYRLEYPKLRTYVGFKLFMLLQANGPNKSLNH